ncbi:MAG: C1 family peptidase [Acidobacteria bacterium]|nr:C1 family peptidase [Acidobacteriota bacterium]
MAFYHCDWDDDDSGDDGGFGDEDDGSQDGDSFFGDDEEQEDEEESEEYDEELPVEEGAGDGSEFEPELPPDATEEDYYEDDGNWSADDYAASAERIFGQNEFFGETIDDQLADAGFQHFDQPAFLQNFDRIAPGAADTVRLYERDGQLHAFGFIPMALMALLQRQYSGIIFDYMNVTVPRKGELVPPQPLPPEYAAIEPKPAIDMRSRCTPVGDQANTSRCAAFAWTHAVELTRNLDGKPTPRLSPSYAMLQFQRMQGDAQDYTYAHEGGTGTIGGPEPGEVLSETGTCRQDLWPDNVETPKASERFLAADAQQYKLEGTPLPIALDDVKKVLSAQCPVQVGMNTGPGFAGVGRDGIINAAERASGRHGRHAMLIVGYQGNFYTVKNSWGPQWGDNGYCYIPKSVFADAESEFVAVLRDKPLQAGSAR